jgi:iron complex transport system permease protein
MGGLDVVGFEAPLMVLIFVLVGMFCSFHFSPEFDVLCTGEELAISRGVDVPRVRAIVFFATSFMVGGCVSFVGPIGFVGLVLPHVSKFLCPGSHRVQLIFCSLLSASFLVCCDLIARTLIYPAEIPIGIVTSLIGAPFFLWILIRSHTANSL